MLRMRWVAFVLAFALVGAQALGFMHRVVHAPHGGDAHDVSQHWATELFEDHDDETCRLLDALGHALTAFSQPPAPLVPPNAVAAALDGGAIARHAAQFRARAPPFASHS